MIIGEAIYFGLLLSARNRTDVRFASYRKC